MENKDILDVVPKKLSQRALTDAFKAVRWSYKGKVCNVIGTIVEAILPNSQLGTIVKIDVPGRSDQIVAEVVGYRQDKVLLLPYTHMNGVSPGCIIHSMSNFTRIPVGDFLLGKVVDPFLNPLNESSLEIPSNPHYHEIDQAAPNPMERQRITSPLSLGVRAIDGLLTLGQGQRIGIMSGSGVGKSVLMGMMAKNSNADVNVIALLGERGREVREFIERDLGQEGLARSVLVTVTSDQSPLMRIRGAKVATTIAEHFSFQGRNVLLIMDSLTRVAQSQREIGNAIGESPTTRGYTPSVFSLLPKLLERTGPQILGRGSISGIYTVLVDGDDFNEPIADATRSILDGHINLSRTLAAKGHYPAIDITTSASRVMNDVISKEHRELATRIKSLLGTYQEKIDVVQIGAYQNGSNPALDEAIYLMPQIESFLRQDIDEKCNLNEAVRTMQKIFEVRN
ncbi:MAG: FliI/YscN family ATPase [Oligoflexales bacterium]|nr:FliI/YscN family ATPase [Oligoflexales bacterium]